MQRDALCCEPLWPLCDGRALFSASIPPSFIDGPVQRLCPPARSAETHTAGVRRSTSLEVRRYVPRPARHPPDISMMSSGRSYAVGVPVKQEYVSIYRRRLYFATCAVVSIPESTYVNFTI